MNLYVSIWDTANELDRKLTELNFANTYTKIVILAHFEWSYTSFISSFTAFERLVDKSIEKNIPMEVIVGCHRFTDVEHDVTKSRYNNIKITHWPTFWSINFGHKVKKNNNVYKIDKLFCLLNGNYHEHRCLTMDLLCKHNLLENGYVSWLDRTQYTPNYNFQYWQPKIMTLDTFEQSENLFMVPEQFHKSFMNIVSESNMTPYFLTEKTTKPLYYKKPFLVISKPGYHTRMLTDLGFQLYDEIFDYSFDTVDDVNLRVEQVVLQLKKFEKYSMERLAWAQARIQKKIDYNHKKLLDYMYNVDKWPKEILEYVDDPMLPKHTMINEIYNSCIKTKDRV